MSTIKATVRGGRLEVDEPIDLPDGTELRIPLPDSAIGPEDEDGWDNSPEGIADWLKWYDSLEPLLFTPQEEADADAWLKAVNQYAIDKMNKGGEDVFR